MATLETLNQLSSLIRTVNSVQNLSMFDDGFISLCVDDGNKWHILQAKTGSGYIEVTKQKTPEKLVAYLEGMLKGLQTQIIDL